MLVPALDVAKFILRNSEETSNLKLQKLLYYVQGWHLGLWGKPLFREDVQAWVHGPVVPEVFREYRAFRWLVIEKPNDYIEFSPVKTALMEGVLGAYGKFTAVQLERLTHSEKPWIEARTGLRPNESSQRVITQGSMREFFARTQA